MGRRCCRGKMPKGNGILLIFVLFLLFLLFIQRLQIENLQNDCDDDCSVDVEQEEYVAKNALPALSADAERKQEPALEAAVAAVTAKEIGPSAPRAAVQAQCIIVRTNLYDAAETGASPPKGMEEEEMRRLWGEDYENYKAFYETCASETAGEVLIYDNAYIYAAYHAVSAGTTRSMEELYTDSDMPYLKPISCPYDTSAEGYLSVCYWERAKFLEMCGQFCGGQVVHDTSEVKVTKRDTSEYVLEVQISNEMVTGEEFRDAFGLDSACFTITDLGDKVRVVTKGRGHGFGLSQNTAVRMAKEGTKYREILLTFFEGCDIKKLKES